MDFLAELPSSKSRYNLFSPVLTRLVSGNCLYYSLSDQLFGDFTHGNDIRQRVADHMSNNKEYFMQFVSQGGERRRPRRAAASAYATRSADVPSQSEQEKERLFTDMIAKSRKNGEWAGSEHIQAFCQAYRLDVGVYTSDGVRSFQDVNSGPDESRNVVHVAFHVSILFCLHPGAPG
jgi:hypothetical protein